MNALSSWERDELERLREERLCLTGENLRYRSRDIMALKFAYTVTFGWCGQGVEHFTAFLPALARARELQSRGHDVWITNLDRADYDSNGLTPGERAAWEDDDLEAYRAESEES